MKNGTSNANEKFNLTVGSLFDGAGTCCLAAELCGMLPIWSSEIEKFPLDVTAKRFPKVKQLGDITKINGAEIEPVNIITFGSPCQDLSIAGKRGGLDGERSGLFMEAIRIIKEMRNATANEFPRFIVWENVPGAYSSNKGEDFRTVLKEIVNIEDGCADIPQPSKKWNGAGYILGNGYSVAWRTLDAQFWGVPQRRRRIYLVADFRGECAGEILFKREGLSRSFATVSKTWKRLRRDSTAFVAGSNNSGQCYDARGNGDGNTAPTLTGDHENRVTDYSALAVCFDLNRRDVVRVCGKTTPTLLGMAGTGGGNLPVVCYSIDRAAFNQGQNAQFDISISDDGKAHTLVAKGPSAVCYVKDINELIKLFPNEKDEAVELGADVYNGLITGSVSSTLGVNCGFSSGRQSIVKCYCLQGNCIDRAETAGCNGKGVKEEESYTLNTIDRHAVCVCYCGTDETYFSIEEGKSPTLKGRDYKCPHYVVNSMNLIVRRLTPTECARLQGMPDWWVDGVLHSDSAEYKMWGNGMALPNILYVMEGIYETYNSNADP